MKNGWEMMPSFLLTLFCITCWFFNIDVYFSMKLDVLQQKLAKKDGAIDRQHDIERLWKFYVSYKRRHRVDDIQKEQQKLLESGNFSTTNLGEYGLLSNFPSQSVLYRGYMLHKWLFLFDNQETSESSTSLKFELQYWTVSSYPAHCQFCGELTSISNYYAIFIKFPSWLYHLKTLVTPPLIWLLINIFHVRHHIYFSSMIFKCWIVSQAIKELRGILWTDSLKNVKIRQHVDVWSWKIMTITTKVGINYWAMPHASFVISLLIT